jgi:hypothetical protein
VVTHASGVLVVHERLSTVGLSRIMKRLEHDFLLGPPRRRSREHPETAQPGERATVAPRRQLAGYVFAVVLPAAVSLALLPLRADHSRLVALILVVPVVAIALLGGLGPAVVAAISAGASYGIMHTRPYWHVVIDDADEVGTTITLLIVAVTVGLLCGRVVQLNARDASRRHELDQVLAFMSAAASGSDIEVLSGEVCRRLTALLNLRECRWSADYRGGVGPVLEPTGAVSGRAGDLNPDRATLPDNLEIPAIVGSRELGRFVLTPDRRTVVSDEERLTAATIVGLFARLVAQGS